MIFIGDGSCKSASWSAFKQISFEEGRQRLTYMEHQRIEDVKEVEVLQVNHRLTDCSPH
jgi:hypothetical protein